MAVVTVLLKKNRKRALFIAALLLSATGGAFAAASDRPESDEAVFAPMRAEMSRAMKGLRQDSFGPPYFIAYRLLDERSYHVSASFGGILREYEYRWRTLFVELRYGDRHMDNTGIAYKGWHAEAPTGSAELRQSLWLLTDEAYKDAIAGYLEKKALRVTQFIKEKLDDFSVEASTKASEAQPPSRWNREAAEGLVVRLSAVLRRHPKVYSGTVSIDWTRSRRYLLTSEGTRIASPYRDLPGSLHVDLASRAPDGLGVADSAQWVFKDLGDLPPEKQLESTVERRAEEIEALRKAPLQYPVAAPAIFDPEMTGVLFHEALGHKLEGERQRDPEQGQIFKGMLGKKIIPSFLSVIDDPTMASFGGTEPHGHYDFDDEGVPAQRVVLVDRGILRNFLMSRWPLKALPRSNGHGRSDGDSRPLGRMANLMVIAAHPVSPGALKARLLDLIRREHKPYGLHVIGAFGGDNPTERSQAQTLELKPRLIYRVSARDGRETLVRGVKIVVTPLVVLNRILAAADDQKLSNAYFCGAESGWVPVDQIAPSVLISEIEVQRLPEDRRRPPILPSPFKVGNP